ncbi:MAG: 1-deoxy-D-xylulose-5-phosphate synthase, partial [Ruminococcus sp.]|nr:1-deoxy-D-xylulose-5-phosphate synthase [Ruminococcus sp.]
CVFGRRLTDLAYEHKNICAVTAAMKFGTGLQYFHKAFPDRFFDVGIAEQHAATFCAGLASSGMVPVFAVYSTFLQRSYDQLLHDIGILGLHIVIGVDRAGIVGEDGETHQGIFDVSFLTTVPGIKIYSPSCYRELEVCLDKAILEDNGVCAVRYPRGSDKSPREGASSAVDFVLEQNGSRVLAVTYGRLYGELKKAQAELKAGGRSIDILKMVEIFPLSEKYADIMRGYDKVFFFEESYRFGGIGEKYAAMGIPIEISAIDGYVPHGKVQELLDDVGLSAAKMKDRMTDYFDEHDKT